MSAPPGSGSADDRTAIVGPDWNQVADAVWLAAVAGVAGERQSPSPVPEPTAAPPPRVGGEPPLDAEPELDASVPTEPLTPASYRPSHVEEIEIRDSGESLILTALPGSQRIVRALRPFKRRVLSAAEVEPDEEATAEFGVDTGLWLPRYRPVHDRWLAVVLIVDAGPSMEIWAPTTTSLRLLLDRHGSFRSVRTYSLAGAALHDSSGAARDPAELIDPTGRQLFLVLTDGTGPLWLDPAVDRALRTWGNTGPLAIVNLFPRRYWRWGNLEPRRCRIRPPRPVAPNRDLEIRYPENANPFDEPTPENALPVPIVELSPRWLRWWAGLVTGPPQWQDAVVHAVDPRIPPASPDEPTTVWPRAVDLVRGFAHGASPLAFRLATLFAATPLDLTVLRRVQRALVPESGPHHLAEVLISALVRRTDGQPPSYEFVDGVREELLACSTRDDAARVVRVAAAGHQRDAHIVVFARAIEAPDLAPAPRVTESTLPMAQIELAVLDALSGPYTALADRLRREISRVERGDFGDATANDLRGSAGIDENDTDPDSAGNEGGDAVTTPSEPSGSGDGRDQTEPLAPVGDRSTTNPTIIPESEDPLLSLQELLELESQDTGPTIWGTLPTRNPVFTGRQTLLDQLERRLQTQSVAAVLPQALHGEGGVGKSQIAIEYAYRHRADYDVIWWIPSERPAQILASMIELGNRLGLDVGNEVITAVPKVRQALRAGVPYSNWLLVFDNAETPEIIQEYFPEAGTGKVLVTSRNQKWNQIAESLEVDVFTRAESIRLLQRRNTGLSDEDADRLADALGDLPLAIEHASAWLYATGMAVSEYLELLARKRAELTALMSATGYETPVAAAANVALDRLAVENPAALQLLQVCSFFAPEPISRDLFAGIRTGVADEIDDALRDPSRLNQAIRDIQRYVLARIDHRANTMQLHRLVLAVLRARIPDEETRVRIEHGAHVLLAGGGKPGEPSDPEQWLRYQALASHLTASNAHQCEDHWTRDLIVNLIQFFFYWGDYTSGRELAAQVVEDWRQRLGPDYWQTLEAAKWLGYYYWLAGELDTARAIQQDTLNRFQRTLGPDDEGTIDAMAMVATTLRTSGRFYEARDLDLDAFQRARASIGEDEPTTLRVAHSLAISLRLVGEFRTARQLDGDTYRRRVAVLGTEHPETLRTLNSLTLDERECGEYRRSRQLVERLYQRYVRLFGVGHQETIKVARNLAVARRRAGDHEAAYKLAEDTVARFRERFGETHPDTIAAALNFAVDLRESDDLVRAQALATQTVGWYETILGAEHPYTLYARTNLGVVLRLLGELDDAEGHNRAAWSTLERVLGSGHILTITCGINLASDLAALGDHQGAFDLDEDVLRRSREVLGEEHPSTLACAVNLSFDLTALNRTEEGSTLFDDTLTHYRRVLGPDHPALVAAMAGQRANCDVDPMQF